MIQAILKHWWEENICPPDASPALEVGLRNAVREAGPIIAALNEAGTLFDIEKAIFGLNDGSVTISARDVDHEVFYAAKVRGRQVIQIFPPGIDDTLSFVI